MCKHVAAVLYGVGARLDASPELLLALRSVDHTELVSRAGEGLSRARTPASAKRVMTGGDLASIFGLKMAESDDAGPAAASVKKKVVAKKGKAPAAQLKTIGNAKALSKSVALRAPAKRNSADRTNVIRRLCRRRAAVCARANPGAKGTLSRSRAPVYRTFLPAPVCRSAQERRARWAPRCQPATGFGRAGDG